MIVTPGRELPRRGWRADSSIAVALTWQRPFLSLEALAKRFGGVVATDNVTLDVMPRATCAASSGPNGAGKSTLFALLCGIHRPDGGRIVLKGQDVTRLAAVSAGAAGARASPFRPTAPSTI